MNKLNINGYIIDRHKIGQLSIDKKPDDIMSLTDKVKYFFSKNKEKIALNLIHDIYYNPKISFLEKLDKYNKLKDITGESYKYFFDLSFDGENITFHIDKQGKNTFSLDEIINSIVMDRVEENKNIQCDLSPEKISKSILEKILSKKIATYNSEPSDVIKYINEEYFNFITNKLNNEKEKDNLKRIGYENINYIFKEYDNIDTVEDLKNLFSNKEESNISIDEKIKIFNLLRGIAKDEYQKHFSLNIDNNKITLSIGHLVIENDLNEFINKIKESTELKYNKNKLIENTIILDETITKEIKNKLLLLEKSHIKERNISNHTSIYEKNINPIQVTKNEIKKQLLIKDMKTSEINYEEINKILHSIGETEENNTIFKKYLIDKRGSSDNLKIEIVKFLLSKIDSNRLDKADIIIDNTSIKLIVYGNNNENIELVNFKTKNNYSFLNDIDNDITFNINISDKLLILSEIIRKSNSSKVFKLNNNLITKFIEHAVNNKKLFISYITGLIGYVKKYYESDGYNISWKGNNLILENRPVTDYIRILLNDNIKRDVIEQTKLKYLYAVINDKSHPYYSELKNISDTYDKLIKKSKNKNLTTDNYIFLFFNDKNLTDIEKIKYFENLKLSLNEDHKDILDFNINGNSINFFIKKDQNNGLEENPSSKIISTNIRLRDEIYDKLKLSDKQDKTTLLKTIIEIDEKNKARLADEKKAEEKRIEKKKKQSEFFKSLDNYVNIDLFENLYEDFLKINESPSDSERIKFIYRIMNNLKIGILDHKETKIEIDHFSLTLKIKPSFSREETDLIKIKTNNDLSNLNDLSCFYKRTNKLDIILELEKPSNNIVLNQDVAMFYLSNNYSNKSLYNNYNNLISDYIEKNESYYKEEIFYKNRIDINRLDDMNYKISNYNIEEIYATIVENIEHHSEKSAIDVNHKINQLRFFYSAINDKNNEYHEALTTLKDAYFHLKKERELDIKTNEFVYLFEKKGFYDLFCNDEKSLKEKVNAFNNLKEELMKDNQFYLDFFIDDGRVSFLLKKNISSSHNKNKFSIRARSNCFFEYVIEPNIFNLDKETQWNYIQNLPN